MARILIIDDEPLVRTAVRMLLRRAGHEVEEAADGVAGIAAALAGTFDLVITDVIMPVRDGVEAIGELRRSRPGLKVIAMSGGGRQGNSERLDAALAAGAAAVIRKPFGVAELLGEVNRVLAGGEAG